MFVILAHNWWMLLLRGILAMLFGLMCFVYPGITLSVMTILFGAYALIDGIFAFSSAISSGEVQPRWWSTLLEGVAGILFGLVVLVWPGITVFGLLYLIGGWGIVTGIFEITAAIRLRQYFTNEWLLVFSGAVSVIFGLLILVIPRAGALAVVVWIGVFAVVFGMFYVALALRLKRWVARQS